MIIQGVTLQGATVVDANFINTNTLLYLDAGNPLSYSGTGSTWYDLSGNNNNTTGSSGVTYSSANSGYFNFNGSGWFSTAASKYNTTYTGKTVFLAAKLTSDMGNNTYRCLFGNTGTRNFNLYMYRNNSGQYQIHFDNNSSGGISAATTYTAGNWFTVAATLTTSGLLSYYLNGNLISTSSATFYQYINSSNELVGASDNYWYGPISVVGIYKTALTAAEILKNHNALRVRYGLS